ncbi:MAG: DNA (cytosine-5-)-methyltransferase [Acutalibacteraceae bacterium]
MKHSLTLGSLFDGSGGFPLGGLMCGIKPIWASEIEPFPIIVTTKRLPFMKHYGDINKINGAEIEPVDIITFGSPCTDMSVAGKRAGLDGKQSTLFYQATRIIKEVRCKTDGKYPRWIAWENVPGAFSSGKGEDFRCVLESICKIKDENFSVPRSEKWSNAGSIVADTFSLAWRVLDAQFWGVPQRRKRIYLVADFGSKCAGKILFESEGLSGYSAEGGQSWQRTTGSFTNCTGETSNICLNDQGGNRMDVTEDITSTLRAQSHHPPCVLNSIAVENHPSDSRVRISNNGCVQTLTSSMGTGGNRVPLIMSEVPKTYGICSKDSNSMKSDNPHSGFYEANTSRILDKNGGNPSCNQGGVAVVESIPFTQNQRDEVRTLGNKSGTLNASSNTKQQTFILQGSMIGRHDNNGPQGSGINEDVSFTLNTIDRHAIAYGIGRDAFNQGKNSKWNPCFSKEIQPTLVSRGPGAIQNGYIVRRLTPTECARLQGFPDSWCADLGTENPTYEEIKKWQKIFDDYNKAIGKTTKPKTENQIRKWLKNPHSDSAEYKMWGNGIALPCIYFVLSGIVYCSQLTEE